MINQKKIFTGGMDSDTDPRFIGEHDYLNMENCRVGVSANGKTTRIENMPGTIQITNTNLPTTGSNTCIGTAVDEERRRLVYFIYNSAGYNRIFLYDTIAATVSVLLKESDVTGGLGFQLSNCIDRNAKIIDNLLYWTDNAGDVWSINIQAALNMQAGTGTPIYSSPINADLLKVIKKAPAYPPAILKSYDSGFVGNFIYNEGFKFCWRFTYIDNEVSVLSPYSLLAPMNSANDNFNNIAVTLPTTQTIWQTVQTVDLVVIYSSSNVYYIIKTWDKAIAADATAIANHNSGTPLTYAFYNNQIGEALDSAYASKYFEVIPNNAKTLELARNRAFLGNGTYGYNTPKQTSLSLSLSNVSLVNLSSVPVTRIHTAVKNAGGTQYTIFFDVLHIVNDTVGGMPTGYYAFTYQSHNWAYIISETSGLDSRGVPIVGDQNFIDFVYAGSDIQSIPGTYLQIYTDSTWYVDTTYSITTNDKTPITLQGVPAFYNNKTLFAHNESTYDASVTFYDKYQRKCGNSPIKSIYVPDAIYSYPFTNLYAQVNWSLSNTNALSEIPNWAYYYSVNVSKNLTKSFFFQGYSRRQVFYSVDATTGAYVFNTTDIKGVTYGTDKKGIAFDISDMISFGIGYTFNEGDLLKYGTSYTGSITSWSGDNPLRVVGQSGNWVLCELRNIYLGTTGSPVTYDLKMFEIYTPYKASANEPIYEEANIYPITNADTDTRVYSTLSGKLQGDTYIINRIGNISTAISTGLTYFAFQFPFKAMSPVDSYWQHWYTDAGRSNYIDKIGQKYLPNRISFSNTYLAGTLTNGLSSFDALNVADTYIEDGAIQKLQLANKQKQEDGAVLLAICLGGTISIYLGETQLVSQTGNAFLGQSNGVIGTMNDLKGSFGTENPESVFTYLGEVYWVDNYNGVMVQYSTNGLFPISSYKMASYFLKALKEYLNTGTRIAAAFDPTNKEALFVMPAIDDVSINLPSYSGDVPDGATTIQNRFSPFDGNNKTLAFRPAENKWSSAYEFAPEWMESVDVTLYGFQNGQLWKHNADTSNYNKFYGVNKAQRIMFAVNDNPFDIKDMLTIAIEGKQSPSYAFIYTTYPNEQITDLIGSDFVLKEGIYYASILRDRLSPNAGSSNPDVCLLQGDPIKSATPFIWVEFQVFDKMLEVNFVDAGYAVSRGHNTILKK